MSDFKVIQPVMWAGFVHRDGYMTCGACPDRDACIEAGRCARASDEDYKRGLPK